MLTNATFSPDSIVVGTSDRMRAVFDVVRVFGDSASTVLITGESGTGKEVIATLIHQHSPRRLRPFIPVSCAIFNETLIESELFGHERGAFTGAVKDRPGRFELATGGTVFLDDIDDVPLSMQVKLLRVLQNRTVERLGGVRPIPVDVRVIAGSKRDLKQLVAEGKFRDDLYYRLNVLPIALPPLRERREDISALMDHFLRRFFDRRGEPVPQISPAIRRAFAEYAWPGNVRELENACERISLTCICGRLQAGCLPPTFLLQASGTLETAGTPSPPPMREILTERNAAVSLDDRLRALEAELICWALGITGGNKSEAAKLLKLKRSTLIDRINRSGIDRGSTHALPSALAVAT